MGYKLTIVKTFMISKKFYWRKTLILEDVFFLGAKVI